MLGNSKFCKKYLCANAGLYTFYNESENYPYGICNLKKYNIRIKKSLEKEVYILAGEKDINTKLLNSLPKDIEEGMNRYDRALNYFASAKKYAEKYNIKFNWNFISMPKGHHNFKEVIPFAIKVINN